MAYIGLKQLDPVLTGSLQVSGSSGVTGSLDVDTNIVVGNRVTSDYGTVNYSLLVNSNAHGGGDFRVKSANNTYQIFSDSNQDKVGIGFSSAPTLLSSLHIGGDITATHVSASGNISASGDLIVNNISASGDIIGPTDDNFDIKSDQNIRLYLDKDNDGSFHKFQVYDGSGNVRFAVAEDGKTTIGEAVTSNHIDGLTVAGGIHATGNVSGSVTSTGSFGRLEVAVVEANTYIVSSSVTNISIATLSGSTEFGDTADDTHTFTGNITASGNINTTAGRVFEQGTSVIDHATAMAIVFGG
jgi:hypothetical protein|tara:strand:- start:734 stop:1630 length:897 start_codon:yes stop_codon:yes gene_type:complete